MNNGKPHDLSTQEYCCDLTRCTFYFDNNVSNTNRIRATFDGNNTLLFSLQQRPGSVDAYITIPNGFHCTHYKNATVTTTYVSQDSHLSYHGKPKGKKITGEIHVKNAGANPLGATADKIDAPLASSRNITIHPLPICRIELSENCGSVTPKNEIQNYFELRGEGFFFNTIEIHLARRGYMKNLASVAKVIHPALASLFIHVSMHAFYLGKIERRPGLFPQALAVQTNDFELIILATHEYKNPTYAKSSIRFFHTKDYLDQLSSRNIIYCDGGFFIDQLSNLPMKSGAVRLSSILGK